MIPNNSTGQIIEQKRKKIIVKVLKIIADTTLTQTNFLDATFSLAFKKLWLIKNSNDKLSFTNIVSI